MKNVFIKITAFAVATFAALSLMAASTSFDVHTRVGDGFHMYSTVTVSDDGQINGTTTLKNYNNIKGFTGGVFAVALDANGEAVYATEIKSFGVNAAFFKACRERTVTWTDTIPAEYLPKVDKMTVVQVHNPTYRVWTWIYKNREVIIDHAYAVADLFKKYQNNELTAEEINGIIAAHLNR